MFPLAEPSATVSFCEGRLDMFPAEPSNTWSSLGYVVVGVWLLGRSLRAHSLPLALIAIAELGIGIGSIALHGTASFAGEVMDLSGMFLLSAGMVASVSRRLFALRDPATALVFAIFFAGPLGVLLPFPAAGILCFAASLSLAIGGELFQQRRRPHPQFGMFGMALALFLLAFASWVLDFSGLVCSPANHVLTGHAVWHLLNAFSIQRLYAWYSVSERQGAAAVARVGDVR